MKPQNRKAYNENWIVGKNAVLNVLKNPNRTIQRFVTISKLASTFSTYKPEIVTEEFFHVTFGNDTNHQCCAVLSKLKQTFLEDILDVNRPIIVLDQVQDPQNFGVIIRNAAVFNASAIIIAKTNNASVTPLVTKIASGALEHVPIITVTNISHTLLELQQNNFWCIGLSESGEKFLDQIDLSVGKFVFVIGNEGTGLRQLTKTNCDMLTKFRTSEIFSTLNAAQSVAVTLYEYMRQQCHS